MEQVIKQFRDNYIGKFVRGQMVEEVGISIDTIGAGIRYFAILHFRNNPPTNESPEQNILELIFSDIPLSADILCSSWEELLLITQGPECVQQQWRLADETREGYY